MVVERHRWFAKHEHGPYIPGEGMRVSSSFTPGFEKRDVKDARCWRCGGRTGPLVDVSCHSEDESQPRDLYHPRCIPPKRFHALAGSFPAWETLIGRSPDSGTRSIGASD
jgi:hypothetical protein